MGSARIYSEEEREQDAALAALLMEFSHPVRLFMVRWMVRNGPMNVGGFVEMTGELQPAISQHLQRLKKVGAVEREQIGNKVYYRVEDERIIKLVNDLTPLEEDC